MRFPWSRRVVVTNADGSRVDFPDVDAAAEFAQTVGRREEPVQPPTVSPDPTMWDGPRIVRDDG